MVQEFEADVRGHVMDVDVVVERLGDVPADLTEDDLRTQTELKLREAAITVDRKLCPSSTFKSAGA